MNKRKTRSSLKKVLAAAAALVTVLPAFSGMPALNLFPQAALTASAADIVESGTCGDNLTWILDSEGTLTISGTGPMWDYDAEQSPNEVESYIPCYAPWYCVLYNKYKTVVIEPGVTSIGDGAFSDGENLIAVQIPDSVTSIGREAFCGCSSLTSITIPGNVESIGSEAFFGCSSLTGISILNPECQIYSFLGRTIPTQTVIYGETGSTAEEYAQEFNRTFVPIGTIWKQNDGTLYFRNGFSADELKNYSEKLSVTRIVCEPGTKLPEDCGYLFYGYFRAESFDLSAADTSAVTRMIGMFYDCNALKEIDLSNFDMRKVADTSEMFGLCAELRSVKLGNAAQPAPSIDTKFMFYSCYQLRNVSLPAISDTSNQYRMFKNCNQIETMQLGGGFAITEEAELPACGSGRLWTIQGQHTYVNTAGQTYDTFTAASPDTVYAVAEGYRIDLNPGFTVAGSPFPGNTAQCSFMPGQTASFPGYLFEDSYCGWYDVKSDCFLTANDAIGFDSYYVLRCRIKAENNFYFPELTRELLNSLKVTTAEPAYLEYPVAAAHDNGDGTCDFYSYIPYQYIGYVPSAHGEDTVNVAQSSGFGGYYLPEGTVYEHPTWQSRGAIPVYKTLPARVKAQETVIHVGTMAMQAPYASVMGSDSDNYYGSIDGGSKVRLSAINGIGFTGLRPGTSHLIDVYYGDRKFFSKRYSTQTTGTPIEIIEQPQNACGGVGDLLTLTVAATGGDLSYQWQYDNGSGWKDSTVATAKTAAMNITVTAAKNGFKYRCVLTNSSGSENITDMVTLTVLSKITAQPEAANNYVGDTAKFTVGATGAGLTYQWQFDSGSGWTNSSATSAVTDTLKVSVTAAKNGFKYRCIITDANGQTMETSAVPLNVLTKITAQPKEASVYVGNTATFTVGATGAGLKYQWQFNSGNSWTNSSATSATTDTLKVSVTGAKNGFQYRCIISDANSKTKTTSAVKLTVLTKITAQPKAASAYVGDTVKFSVTATGAGLKYQWQYDSGKGWTNSTASTAKKASLSVSVTAAKNGFKYRCIITDANGKTKTSSAVALTVLTKITAQPKAASAYVGDTAEFTVAATGAGLKYQWQYNNGKGWTDSTVATAKTDTLKVSVTAAKNGFIYRCIITDANGKTKTSSAVALSVLTKITAQPKSVSSKVGYTVKFSVTATGAGLTYQWQYNNGSGWTNSTVSTAKTASLSVSVTAAKNGFQYRCIITDAHGKTKTSNTATLTVK